MISTIEEMYYEQDNFIEDESKEYKFLCANRDKLFEKLKTELKDTHEDLLQEFDDICAKIEEMIALSHYKRGYKRGVLLMIDTLKD